MRNTKSTRHTTEAEDEEIESEKKSQDVFELLKTDHRRVEALFSRFEGADKRTKSGIVEEALAQLEIHAALEEELVYPAIWEATDNEDMVDAAKEKHHVVKLLIKVLRKMDVAEQEFTSKFKALREVVRRHVEEEEKEMFPQAEEAGLDTEGLGGEVAKRKAKLMQKLKHERGSKKLPIRRKAA